MFRTMANSRHFQKQFQKLTQLAYYQAGKIVVQTLLPQHPPTTLISLNLLGITTATGADTYIPVDNSSRTHWCSSLESRLIGLYGGKATSSLLEYQYGANWKSSEMKFMSDRTKTPLIHVDMDVFGKKSINTHLKTTSFDFVDQKLKRLVVEPKALSLGDTGVAREAGLTFASPKGSTKSCRPEVAREAAEGVEKSRNEGVKQTATDFDPSSKEIKGNVITIEWPRSVNIVENNVLQSDIGNLEIQSATQLAATMVNKWNFYSLKSFFKKEDTRRYSLPLWSNLLLKRPWNEGGESTIIKNVDGGLGSLTSLGKILNTRSSKTFYRQESFVSQYGFPFCFDTWSMIWSLKSRVFPPINARGISVIGFDKVHKQFLRSNQPFLPQTKFKTIKKTNKKKTFACLSYHPTLTKQIYIGSKNDQVLFLESYLRHLNLLNHISCAYPERLVSASQAQRVRQSRQESRNKLKERPNNVDSIGFKDSERVTYIIPNSNGVMNEVASNITGITNLNVNDQGIQSKYQNDFFVTTLSTTLPYQENQLPYVSWERIYNSNWLHTPANNFVSHTNDVKNDCIKEQTLDFSKLILIRKTTGEDLHFAISQPRSFCTLNVHSIVTKATNKTEKQRWSYNEHRTSVENVLNKAILRANVFQLVNPIQFSSVQRDRFYPGWFRLYLPDIEVTEFIKNVANYYFSLGSQTLTRPSLKEFNPLLHSLILTPVPLRFRPLVDKTACSTKFSVYSSFTNIDLSKNCIHSVTNDNEAMSYVEPKAYGVASEAAEEVEKLKEVESSRSLSASQDLQGREASESVQSLNYSLPLPVNRFKPYIYLIVGSRLPLPFRNASFLSPTLVDKVESGEILALRESMGFAKKKSQINSVQPAYSKLTQLPDRASLTLSAASLATLSTRESKEAALEINFLVSQHKKSLSYPEGVEKSKPMEPINSLITGAAIPFSLTVLGLKARSITLMKNVFLCCGDNNLSISVGLLRNAAKRRSQRNIKKQHFLLPVQNLEQVSYPNISVVLWGFSKPWNFNHFIHIGFRQKTMEYVSASQAQRVVDSVKRAEGVRSRQKIESEGFLTESTKDAATISYLYHKRASVKKRQILVEPKAYGVPREAGLTPKGSTKSTKSRNEGVEGFIPTGYRSRNRRGKTKSIEKLNSNDILNRFALTDTTLWYRLTEAKRYSSLDRLFGRINKKMDIPTPLYQNHQENTLNKANDQVIDDSQVNHQMQTNGLATIPPVVLLPLQLQKSKILTSFDSTFLPLRFRPLVDKTKLRKSKNLPALKPSFLRLTKPAGHSDQEPLKKLLTPLDLSFSLSLEKQMFPIGFNDVSVIENEFIFHTLINNCFAKATLLVDQNRQLIDYFADYLIRFQILRQHEILYLFSAMLLHCKKQM